MPLVDLSGTHTVISQSTTAGNLHQVRISEATTQLPWAPAGAPRGIDGLVWPTGVQRFGKAAS